MKLVILTGNLIKEPVIAETKDGRAFCSFTIAVNSRAENGDKISDLYNCYAFGGLGELIHKSQRIGDRVFVVGDQFDRSTYTDSQGEQKIAFKVRCIEVEFLKKANRDKGQETEQSKGQAVKVGEVEIDESDIPF